MAESPGIKITDPKDGSIVHPGEEITVRIEAVERFIVERGVASIAGSDHNEDITSLPVTFTDKIPLKAIGEVNVSVFGRDASGNLAMDDITLKVEQTATLQSLEGLPEELPFETDWDGNIKDFYYPYMGGIYGMYSDGIKRDITHAGTTYISSDPSVISIDSEGKFQVHKVGDATITASNSGVSKIIPVVFEKPHGIRPSETIPPTTTIDIQPPANAAGWHNQDITITITAQDNEVGSGVQYIDYRFPRLQGEYEYKRDNRVIVPFSQEGEYEFWYCATDNEANREDVHSTTIHLDKTPPVITSTISPQPNTSGWNNSDVKVSFSAQDKLSGVKSITPAITVTAEGKDQTAVGEALDIAENKSSASVSLNLDKTPPQIFLELKPINLSEKEKEGKEDEGNWYELIYSATDNLSGVKALKGSLVILPINDYKVKLKQHNRLEIRIDEDKKELKIEAPNPQEILIQLQNGLFNLNNNQILQLKLKKGHKEWKIKEKEKGIEIETPSVIFKAEAADYADNISTEQV